MSNASEQPISAVKGDQKREFTPTQWGAMGKDKAGWKAAKPAEALLSEKQSGGGDVALLDARQRYAALFDKQPAANAKLETLEAKISEELAKQNAGNKTSTPPVPPVPPVAPVAPAAPSAPATDTSVDEGKAKADASKGLDSQKEQA